MTSHPRAFGPPLPIDDSPLGHRLVLPTKVISDIERMLPKRVDEVFHENVLYIAGTVMDNVSEALVCIQPEANTTPGSYKTTPRSHLEVLRTLRRLNLVLVGQIHCHPGSYVEHSVIDDQRAVVRGEGFWSIVVPDYGRHVVSIGSCGVHSFSEGAFRLLSQRALAARVTILEGYPDLKAR